MFMCVRKVPSANATGGKLPRQLRVCPLKDRALVAQGLYPQDRAPMAQGLPPLGMKGLPPLGGQARRFSPQFKSGRVLGVRVAIS